ncbi:DEAD/DEAH box helicase [Pseudobutyrivibrio sp.]
MMGKDWRSWFEPKILDRGYNYFLDGNVQELKKTAGGYQVFVTGTSRYTVRIALNNEEVIGSSCNCHHAIEGNRCKHQAAALFKYEAFLQDEDEEDLKYRMFAEENDKLRDEIIGKQNEGKGDFQILNLDLIEKELFDNEEERNEALLLARNDDVSFDSLSPKRDSSGRMYISVKGNVKDESDGKSKKVSFDVAPNVVGNFRCDCKRCNVYSRSFSRYFESDGCKHTGALFYAAYNKLKEQTLLDATTPGAVQLIKSYQNSYARRVALDVTKSFNEPINLQPKVTMDYDGLHLSFKVGTSRMYVIRNITDFVNKARDRATMQFGKNTVLNLAKENLAKDSIPYLLFMNDAVRRIEESVYLIYGDSYYDPYYYGKKHEIKSQINLEGSTLDVFFDTFKDRLIDYEFGKSGMLHLMDGDFKGTLNIIPLYQKGTDVFAAVRAEIDFPVFLAGAKHLYYIKDEYLYRISDKCEQAITPLLNEVQSDNRVVMEIGYNYISDFYHTVLPELKDYFNVVESDKDEIRKYISSDVEFVFYLDAENGNVTCKVKACYGENEYNALDSYSESILTTGNLARERIVAKEKQALNLVQEFLPVIDEKNEYFHCDKDEDRIYEFMVSGVAELAKFGEIQATDAFQRINRFKETKLSVGVSISSGMLDLQVSSDEVSREELLEILASYRAKKKYHRLRDDSFIDLNDEALATLDEMISTLQISEKDFLKDNMHVPVYRTLYLDKLLEENEGIYEERDSHFKDLVKGFKTVKDADFKAPESLSKIMRNYQKTGFKWISTLDTFGFGGILCDDMGLGKTLQTISFLLKHYSESVNTKPSLIVCPASLIYNWQDEFNKFAPDIRVCPIAGIAAEREEIISKVDDYQVLITSYDLLKRDIALYEDKEFYYEIIDEAQYIKNHTTAAAKAVKVINSERRLALTGTPIENRLSELWSIFDFLMPGFLYKYEQFRRQFETPIVKYEDKVVSERLKKMVAPFLLRRLKENVLKELPEKIEKQQVVVMDNDQQTLYDAQVSHLKQMLEESKANGEFSKIKMKILSEMTRLRQICCDPSLFIENYKGESAKRAACMDLIERAIEAGHRILIFSQFTTMLDLLKVDLKEAQIGYFEITGSTKKEDRIELVNRFNEGENNVFLISLKAGGTGLNLTGADMVIHYDPWWNLAAQNQATDRAHRIGQKNMVTVYKLITKGTIEEKIVALQNSKSDLADEILSGETNVLSKMTEADFMELLA